MQRIGVLRGGVSDEYSISLKSGAKIIEAIRGAGYEVLDMLIDRDGVLHIKGLPANIESVAGQVDMVWNTLHGEGGEDGQIQRLLDDNGIKYCGSGALTCSLAHNKMFAKEVAKDLGLKSPDSILVMPEGNESVSEITQNIYKRISPPWVVKPLKGGASIRTYFAFTSLELAQFVEENISHGAPFLVEQYIYGKEASVSVIEGFRGKDLYVLPVVEIKSSNRGVLNHDDRLKDEHVIVGGAFHTHEKEKLISIAKDLHKNIGAKDFSQSDFIVDKNGKIWYLETDTIPHFHEQGSFSKAMKSVGGTFGEFVKSIINNKK